jgi:hypothetical protein
LRPSIHERRRHPATVTVDADHHVKPFKDAPGGIRGWAPTVPWRLLMG